MERKKERKKERSESGKIDLEVSSPSLLPVKNTIQASPEKLIAPQRSCDTRPEAWGTHVNRTHERCSANQACL